MNDDLDPDVPLTRLEMALLTSMYVLIAAAVALIVGVTLWGVWMILGYVYGWMVW